MSEKTSPPAPTRPDIPQRVVKKLLLFSLAMVVLPLLSFFVVRGIGASAVWSGGAAALVANLVLVGYVIVAFTEDLSELNEPDLKSKKEN